MSCEVDGPNTVTARADGPLSGAMPVVCSDIIIRTRLLCKLDPALGEASVYRTRDLVPPETMPTLARRFPGHGTTTERCGAA